MSHDRKGWTGRDLPAVDTKATGQRIKHLREAAGLSAQELADMLEIQRNAVYRWQYGDIVPRVDNLVAMAAIFDVTVDEILVVEGESDETD